MAGGEDDEGRVVNKPVFPPYPERPPDPAHLYPNKDPLQTHPPLPPGQPVPPAPIGYVEKPNLEPVYPTAPIPPPQLLPPQAIGDSQVIGDSPVARSDPPATTADDPVDLPPVNDENFGEHMSEVLAKVAQEELVKTGQVKGDAIKVNENLSTDPNMPVFMKRKRGRPRKHPLPEQRRSESTGRRVGRPPKNSNRVLGRKIKKEPVEEPMMVEQMLEDEFAEHLPSEQSLAQEEDRDENAIRFTDVGNHLPLLVAGQHLCAVCLSRHSHRQSAGVRRTRSTSFKRFTSVICRTCNKFLCVAPRTDGRTCFDIYHTMKDFVRSDLPEFNRKECGDSDVISNDFDDSPDLTEDANMLLQLLQVASGEINKMSDLDSEGQTKDPLETSTETVFPETSDTTLDTSQSSETATPTLADPLQNNTETTEGETPHARDSTSESNSTKPEVREGQSQAINLLLKVLKNHRVLSVSETLQLRLERRPRKYNMTNRTSYALSSLSGGSPEELTRKYRRKGRPRKHVSTDEEGEKGDEIADDSLSIDGEGPINAYNDIITPGIRRKYACGRCHAEFNLIARMKVHLKAHVERKTYNCTTCSVSFRTKGKLAEHRKMHKTEKTHKCPKCDETFKKMILLRRHMRSHQDIKPYECRICGSRFSYASSLKEHALNKHLGERPFKCSECDQGFTRQINLLEHMRMHTGERPFKCSKCDQSFARKSGLKSHMISHTGEKKHMCSTCGARFRHKIALTEHQRTHTGEKPFACSHCGQRFAASTTLRNHVRLHTGEKPHKCKVCGAGFAQRTSLNCHMKKHGINPPPESKSPRNNWTKNFKQTQNPDQGMLGQEGGHIQSHGQMTSDHLQSQAPPGTPQMHHHNPEHPQQPHDYSDKSHMQGHNAGHGAGHGTSHGDAMMAQAVSMAFNKMVPDMLQGGMVLPRRPDSGPPPGVNTSQSHTMSHHHIAQPQPTHHSMAPTHRPQHDALQGTGGHMAVTQAQNHGGRSSILHSDVHSELERPSSHSNHGSEVKTPAPMPLTSTASPWSQDPTNLPTFPFDPAFHPQMSQSFPGMLPGQPNHGHSYPEQPRFPFDNRFGMDAWPGHTNWKHKYQ